MFRIGEYAVCPGHGVGKICDIEERQIGEENKLFYIIRVLGNGMTVMVPTEAHCGIRELISDEEIHSLFEFLSSNENIQIDTSTWNRRYRDYMAKIKTGNIMEVALVFRDLSLLKITKGLSYGEKKMLDQCKDLLVEELAISLGHDRPSICQKIDSCFANLKAI